MTNCSLFKGFFNGLFPKDLSVDLLRSTLVEVAVSILPEDPANFKVMMFKISDNFIDFKHFSACFASGWDKNHRLKKEIILKDFIFFSQRPG